MKQTFTKITVVLKPNVINDYYNLLPNLVSWLTRRKKQIQFLDTEEPRIQKIFPNLKGKRPFTYLKTGQLFNKSDLIITLGGDGTLIGVARLANNKRTPIFGVNLGRLGFITEFSKKEFFEDLDQIFSGNIHIFKVPLLKAEVQRKNQESLVEIFLNDAVLSKYEMARMLTISLTINDEHVYSLSGDGLIVSSAIGSTAYSLAAGGPIMHPEVPAIIITPICPHSLSYRPMVIPEKYIYEIQVTSHHDHVVLTLDGQKAIPITNKEKIVITKNSNRFVYLIKNPQRNYFHTLKEKFDYGRRN